MARDTCRFLLNIFVLTVLTLSSKAQSELRIGFKPGSSGLDKAGKLSIEKFIGQHSGDTSYHFCILMYRVGCFAPTARESLKWKRVLCIRDYASSFVSPDRLTFKEDTWRYNDDTLILSWRRTSFSLADLGEPNDFSYKAKWQYFTLDDSIAVKVIRHWPLLYHCGVLSGASMTIARMDTGDTIRILDLCNTSMYKEGEILKVGPSPLYQAQGTFTLIENLTTKKMEPSSFDLTVLRTTWGILPNKQW